MNMLGQGKFSSYWCDGTISNRIGRFLLVGSMLVYMYRLLTVENYKISE